MPVRESKQIRVLGKNFCYTNCDKAAKRRKIHKK